MPVKTVQELKDQICMVAYLRLLKQFPAKSSPGSVCVTGTDSWNIVKAPYEQIFPSTKSYDELKGYSEFFFEMVKRNYIEEPDILLPGGVLIYPTTESISQQPLLLGELV